MGEALMSHGIPSPINMDNHKHRVVTSENIVITSIDASVTVWVFRISVKLLLLSLLKEKIE